MTSAAPVGPPEELMREHGLLNRCLLVYKAALTHPRRTFPVTDVMTSATVVRTFFHDYHEEMEEKYVFPRMKNTPLASMAQTLWDQHREGKKWTDRILSMLAPGKVGPVTASVIAEQLDQFIAMYEPHEAREDTVLFPAWRAGLNERTFYRIAAEMQDAEAELFGSDAFAEALASIEQAEKRLGIYDLAQYAPKPPAAEAD
ncbi:hemerythrin domain-containing protein [Streptomyces noursei]|uniref:hemerythrin domain-containing protein n=1 Tax=Streptomyces noursei TaxID=1971 RepID=UPI003450711D